MKGEASKTGEESQSSVLSKYKVSPGLANIYPGLGRIGLDCLSVPGRPSRVVGKEREFPPSVTGGPLSFRRRLGRA